MRFATRTLGTLVGALLAALVSAGSARAASLTVNGALFGDQVYVQSAARSGWVRPAELDVTVGGDHMLAYCVDLAQTIGMGGSNGWTLQDADTHASVRRAAWLVEYARPRFDLLLGSHPGATRATLISALQVSIWEVLADVPGRYNLYGGNFSLRNDTSANVMNMARGFLGALNGANLAAFETSALWARHGTRQDQVVFNPIPEPSSIALFAAGIGLVAFAGRKRIV
jgi:hypothetical protein